MVKLICGTHNHEMTKSFVGHPYVGRLTKDEKIVGHPHVFPVVRLY